MATLTIRNLPDDIRDRLRVRAAERGRSMEAEAREILSSAVEDANVRPPVAERVRRLQAAFAPYRSATGSIVDEFLAEKRVEAWRDELETQQWLDQRRSHAEETVKKQVPRRRRKA